MYATCIHCTAPLGTNDTIEHFPVGRRLAYDADKGRLWVVCRKCERWNLTPLEERWEAIDDAERLFRATRLRMSTDNIGLARLPDGTDLTRIGQPQRPEMAAWRYGDQFARRRRRILTGAAGGIAGFGAIAVMAPLTGFAAGLLAGAVGMGAMATIAASLGAGSKVFTARYIPDGAGQYFVVGQNELASVRLFGDGNTWGLRMPYSARQATPSAQWPDLINKIAQHEATLHGDVALDAARRLLPLVNGAGARARVVTDAVELLDRWGDTAQVFRYAGSQVQSWAAKQNFGDTGALSFLPVAVRLALEIRARRPRAACVGWRAGRAGTCLERRRGDRGDCRRPPRVRARGPGVRAPARARAWIAAESFSRAS